MMKKYSLALITIILLIVSCTTTTYSDSGYIRPVYIGPGIGLGTIIAMVLSWSRNKSILWAIIHGLLGWLYVIYVIIAGRKS